MSEHDPNPPSTEKAIAPGVSTNPSEAGNANLIYILYLIAFAAGITALVGVIMAYVAKDDAPEWLRSHYRNQINIFWKGLLYTVVSLVLCVVLIGFALILISVIWYVVRIVKGMQALTKGEAIEDPGRWGF